MGKYLINILKDKDFEEIVIADACIYKEGEYFIVSASYSECKLSKKIYRYLKLNGLNTKVRIADNKTPNKKKIDKLFQKRTSVFCFMLLMEYLVYMTMKT